MSFGVLNLVGLGQTPGSGGSGASGSTSGTDPVEQEKEATQGSSSSSTTSSQSSGGTQSSGQTETAVAVKPTPVSEPAVKANFGASKNADEAVLQYPISGPDEFARLSAEMARDANISSQLVEKIGERPDVADVGLDAEELRGSKDEGSTKVDPSGEARVTQEASSKGDAQSSNGVSEQPAEQGEARLTE